MTDLQRVAVSELLSIRQLCPDQATRIIITNRVSELLAEDEHSSLPWFLTDESIEDLLGVKLRP